ncbi:MULTISPECIES: DUF2147 domain-containing protein [Acidiphilium]|uniref:Uncharacterized conserved protein, DUF2147 family n=1 Tax=Acidiphilium rubrum TaxID=526 RepID=A0A8G2FDG6_ACIRU|nr:MULTISPECIES: DUF2147 domain-containing protein [Acidiphilium]SIQ83642.1 Uncharacterized conserved protein, DUF2147 family [Acidiphilium rubrum]
MRRFALTSTIILGALWVALGGFASAAQTPSPVGDWLTGRGGAVVQIAPCADQPGLCGHIVGLMLNHGAAIPSDYQGQPQCGFELIRPSAEHGSAWHGGIVDPRNGSEYHAEFHVTNAGELALRGYIGLPIFGQTQHWMRYQGQVPHSCRINQAQMAQSNQGQTQRND